MKLNALSQTFFHLEKLLSASRHVYKNKASSSTVPKSWSIVKSSKKVLCKILGAHSQF